MALDVCCKCGCDKCGMAKYCPNCGYYLSRGCPTQQPTPNYYEIEYEVVVPERKERKKAVVAASSATEAVKLYDNVRGGVVLGVRKC